MKTQFSVRSINIKPDEYCLSDTENLSDPVEIAFKKFENHLSVQAIKQKCFSKPGLLFL